MSGRPASLAHSPSQAEAVAERLAGMNNNANNVNSDDLTVESTPPSTPPRTASPERLLSSASSTKPPKQPESALKRLAGRLRPTRRSLSAPPALRRRRRPDKLLEEHFVLEKLSQNDKDGNHVVTTVLQPGVPKHEDNWARDLHDFFNLIVLIPVVALNMMNWNWEILAMEFSKWNGEIPNIGNAWTGDYFEEFFAVTALYFLSDLAWITLVPHCVRSPSVIIQHHIATLLYIYVPYEVVSARWFMGACMSVEVNTWLLIARRVFNKQGFPPWTIIDLSFFSIRIKMISLLFYITWISIRCILYPLLLRDIWYEYLSYSQQQHSKINLLLVCFPLHAVFCVLNLKWSYDLLLSKIRYWTRKSSGGANDVTKDKGL